MSKTTYMKEEAINDMMKRLPPELHQEVEDFIQFLIEKRGRRSRKPMKLDWFGGLADLCGQYTSVELQHESFKSGGV